MGTGAIDKIVDALLAYGLAGIVIIAMAYWIMRRETVIKELTDKLFDVAVASTKSSSDSAASINRLTDLLNVRREDK